MCAINQKSYFNINVEKIVIPPGCDVINSNFGTRFG